jgi:hypothetical protein
LSNTLKVFFSKKPHISTENGELQILKGTGPASSVSAWPRQDGREPAANNLTEKYCILDTGIGPLVGMPCFLGALWVNGWLIILAFV